MGPDRLAQHRAGHTPFVPIASHNTVRDARPMVRVEKSVLISDISMSTGSILSKFF